MRVIITGATGWLAGELMAQMVADLSDVEVIGVSRAKVETLAAPYRLANVLCLTNDEYLHDFRHEQKDVIVHTAFCRKSEGKGLVESLKWSSQVFEKAVHENAAGIVNISSQSVYHGDAAHNDESAALTPSYLYALAKAASEVLLASVADTGCYAGGITNLRLASLMGVSSGTCPDNVLKKFVECALAGQTLKIVGGGQKFSFIHVRDAAAAIVCLLCKDPAGWSRAYNIGVDKQVPITWMAQTIAKKVCAYTGRPEVTVEIEPADIELDAGMLCGLARRELLWMPRETIEDIIDETIEYCVKQAE